MKDMVMQQMLQELALENPGLCVITSRQGLREIADYESGTAPRIDLENLPIEGGCDLLKALGVKGSDPDLQEAVREYRGHALVLKLLGTSLCDICNGDIRRRDELRLSLSKPNR